MNIKTFSLFLIVSSLTNPLLAESDDHDHDHDNHDEQMFEEHSSHIHGHANAQISYSQGVLKIHQSLSSIDVFGFEHVPKNDEQKNIVAQNLELMQKTESLFKFENNACQVESVEIKSELHKPDSNSYENHHDHEEEHHHDEETNEDTHTDVLADYTFKCDTDKIESIEYLIFDQFPSLEEIEVQFISEDHPALFQATPSNRIQSLH